MLDADVSANVDIDYEIKGAELFFPPHGSRTARSCPGTRMSSFRSPLG